MVKPTVLQAQEIYAYSLTLLLYVAVYPWDASRFSSASLLWFESDVWRKCVEYCFGYVYRVRICRI